MKRLLLAVTLAVTTLSVSASESVNDKGVTLKLASSICDTSMVADQCRESIIALMATVYYSGQADLQCEVAPSIKNACYDHESNDRKQLRKAMADFSAK